MTSWLEICDPGLHSTVQDGGRYGYQAIGVPVSGALDNVAYRLANGLVGNSTDSAAIEFRFVGPTLTVIGGDILVALTGTHSELKIDGAATREIPAWTSGIVRDGETIRAPRLADTSTAYLAVSGGIATEPVLGSRSTYVRGAIGGHKGRALLPNDRIPVGQTSGALAPLMISDPPTNDVSCLRVLLGPQDHMFTDAAITTLQTTTYTVTAQSDRMGLRLSGSSLHHRGDYNIVSDGITTGAIQVPGYGQPILLLADHQTTGGYPKIGHVITADLPGAGRLSAGDRINFEIVKPDAAAKAARGVAKFLQDQLASMSPAKTAGDVDLDALYRESLISGVTK